MSGEAPLTLFLVAAEPSGDALGAALMAALRERLGERVRFEGVGGLRMEAGGLRSAFDISDLAILGFVEGLRAYPRVVRRADEAAAHAVAVQPDAAVLIDSWGFTLRVAQRLRRLMPGLAIIKYVGPQVWASRPGRARTLAAAVDHVLTLQPFEPPLFEAAGLRATFVGHPALDEPPQGDRWAFRARYRINDGDLVVGVLFGSRPAEPRRLADVFAEAGALLRQRYGGRLALVAPLAGSVATQVRAWAIEDPRLADMILIDEGEKADAMAAMDVAMACSGTVVTELAAAGAPAVVVYKIGALTWLALKPIFRAPHISLVNMAAGERVLPEFVQGEASAPAIADAVIRFLDDPAYAAVVRGKLAEAVARMRGPGGASARTAEAILAVLAARGVMG